MSLKKLGTDTMEDERWIIFQGNQKGENKEVILHKISNECWRNVRISPLVNSKISNYANEPITNKAQGT